MNTVQGIIAIMGSGETSGSMVKVHRLLLQKISFPPKAVFIDTPAGFQLNADELYEKAKEYFRKHLGHDLEHISFKSTQGLSPAAAEKVWEALRQANYIFVGPGSPTYALKNWLGTPLPQILYERIKAGACFVAASAAALTLGEYTLPVYEIYKVGEDLHWVKGMNLLGKFGLEVVVIPHWNNAEGGTHDTRYCYMGEPRLIKLEALLPREITILGIDEHTACILDFSKNEVLIQGRGRVTLRSKEGSRIFSAGETLSLAEFTQLASPSSQKKPFPFSANEISLPNSPFAEQVKDLKDLFLLNLEQKNGPALADTLVQLDKLILGNANEEENTRARQTFWELIAKLGLAFTNHAQDLNALLALVVNLLLEVRQQLRQEKRWDLADEIRKRMGEAGIIIEDTPTGPRWRFHKEK